MPFVHDSIGRTTRRRESKRNATQAARARSTVTQNDETQAARATRCCCCLRTCTSTSDVLARSVSSSPSAPASVDRDDNTAHQDWARLNHYGRNRREVRVEQPEARRAARSRPTARTRRRRSPRPAAACGRVFCFTRGGGGRTDATREAVRLKQTVCCSRNGTETKRFRSRSIYDARQMRSSSPRRANQARDNKTKETTADNKKKYSQNASKDEPTIVKRDRKARMYKITLTATNLPNGLASRRRAERCDAR